MMRILVTGLSGFIGGYLNKRLTTEGHEIIDLACDLLEFEKVRNRVIEVNPDFIIHLAARTEVEKSFYEPTSFSSVNYDGTVNLIESCRDLKNLKLFIFASTMETYGWQPISDEVRDSQENNEYLKKLVLENPFNEETIQNPNAPYSVAKVGCEKYLQYFGRTKDFPFSIIRQTNTYGRQDNNFFVVEQIITQMLKNPKEINLGYRKPFRNFIFIDDLIDFYVVLINKYELAKKQTFCVGPNNALPIYELVDIIAKKVDWNGIVNWDTKPYRQGEIYVLNSTCEKAKRILNWQPKVSLDEGLNRTINIWKNRY